MLDSYHMLIIYIVIASLPIVLNIILFDTTIPSIIVSSILSVAIFTGLFITWLQEETEDTKPMKTHSWYKRLFGWINMNNIGYLCLIAITTLSLSSGYYIYNRFGLFNLSGASISFCNVLLYVVAFYYTYNYFFPTNFWQRLTLKKRHFNTLVDCRNATEFEKGHHTLAQHWPLKTITVENIRDRITDFGKHILVYSNKGTRAKEWKTRVDTLLHDMNMKGYTIYWTDAHWTQIPQTKLTSC